MNILRKSKEDADLIVETFLDAALNKIKNHKDHLSIKGKNIEVANVEQASYLAYYDEIRVDLKSLLAYYEVKVKEAKAAAWKLINDMSKMDHSDREKDILVNNNPSYQKVQRIYLEVKEMYDTLDSICEQFRNRAFTLNNIVKIRVAALEDITLHEYD
jgi:hypothetical protein